MQSPTPNPIIIPYPADHPHEYITYTQPWWTFTPTNNYRNGSEWLYGRWMISFLGKDCRHVYNKYIDSNRSIIPNRIENDGKSVIIHMRRLSYQEAAELVIAMEDLTGLIQIKVNSHLKVIT